MISQQQTPQESPPPLPQETRVRLAPPYSLLFSVGSGSPRDNSTGRYRLAEHDVARPNVPEGRFGAGRAAESGNRGCHSLGLEPAPGVFALPDVGGAEAFVRGAGDVPEPAD